VDLQPPLRCRLNIPVRTEQRHDKRRANRNSGQIGWGANFGGSNDNLAIHGIPLSGVDYTSARGLRRRCQLLVPEYLNERLGSDHQVIGFRRQLALGRVYYGGFQDSGFAVTSLAKCMALPGFGDLRIDHELLISTARLLGLFHSDRTTTFRSSATIRAMVTVRGSGRNSYFDWARAVADWIATEYNNQSSPSTFYTLLPENIAINVTPLVSILYVNQTQQLPRWGAVAPPLP